MILGHEMVGHVVAVGGVETDSVGQELSIGDRIIWTHGMCGSCFECVVQRQPVLCRNRRRYGGERSSEYPYLTGGFAEYCYVYPTAGRVRVPDELSDGAASAASCALRSVISGFDRLGPILGHQTVLVQGSGPLGLFATAAAAVAGADRIIVVGAPENRLALAAAWGASEVLDVTRVAPDGRAAAVDDWTGGRGAEIVIEVSGAREAVGEGMRHLRPGGRYLIIGQGRGGDVPFDPSQIVAKNATILGSLSGGVAHYWRALQFMRRHRDRFDWDAMISGLYALDDVNDALARMAGGSEIKPAISFADHQ
jgi:threonine dehydrogenase-like Zn-dependent dehydrogenase